MSMTIIETRLIAAKDALHKLMIGQMPRVVVDQNGERVEFTMTNVDRLRAYIAELEAILAGATVPLVRRPIGFLF